MEGPPLGPGGEGITWPDQVAPRGRKASSTRKIKPQTSNPSKACGSFVDVGVRFVCQGLGRLDEGDPDVVVSRLLPSPPEDKVHKGLVVALPWTGEVPEGLDGEGGPVLLQAVPAQAAVQGPSSVGCAEDLGVADGDRCDWGVLGARGGLAGWALEVRRVHVDVSVLYRGWCWFWLRWMVSWA